LGTKGLTTEPEPQAVLGNTKNTKTKPGAKTGQNPSIFFSVSGVGKKKKKKTPNKNKKKKTKKKNKKKPGPPFWGHLFEVEGFLFFFHFPAMLPRSSRGPPSGVMCRGGHPFSPAKIFCFTGKTRKGKGKIKKRGEKKGKRRKGKKNGVFWVLLLTGTAALGV